MGASSNAASEQQKEQQRREAILRAGTTRINRVFGQFTPDFYNDRVNAYLAYALPQLNEQAIRTNNDLAYKTANQGLGRSSVHRGLVSSLLSEIGKQKQSIVDYGIAQAQDLRRDVIGNKMALLSQMNSATDPSMVASEAMSNASQFTAPSMFAPIGQMLNNWSNIYLAKRENDMAQNYNNAYKQSSALLPVTTKQ